MNRTPKIVLITGAVVLALIVLPLLALVVLVNPNSFKPQIVDAVRQQTGREFRIDGDLGWSFYPVLGIELGHTELGNAKGFGEKPMLAVDRVAVGVELLPLIHGELNVAQLRLEKPRIHLGKDKSGRSNWDDLAQKAAAAPTAPPPASSSSSPQPAPRIAVAGLAIVDGEVSWNDAQANQAVTLSALNLSTGTINATDPVDVDLSMHASSKNPALDADVEFASSVLFNQKAQLLTLDGASIKVLATGADIPGGKQTLALNLGSVKMDMAKQTLQIPALKAAVGGIELTASVDGKQITDQPQFAGKFALAPLSLRKQLTELGIVLPTMADTNTLQKVAFESAFKATPERVELPALKLTLDDSTISGPVRVALGDVMHIGFELTLDAINADRYMAPPLPENAQAAATQAGVNAASATAIDDSATFAPLDTLAVNGKFSIGKLHVKNVDLSNVDITLKTVGRTVQIDPIGAALYGGKAGGKVAIDGRGARAQTHANILLLGLNVGNFLDAYLQKRGPIEGNGNIIAEVDASGLDGASIMSSASGKGELRFLDGAVRGLNVAQEIRNALALFNKQPTKDAPQKTDFTEMVVPFTIDKGVLSWNDMTANSPLLRIASKGDFNLLTQKINTNVDASVVSTLKGQGGEPLSEIAGFLVPVKVRGAMDDPKISIDIKKVLAQTALGDKQKELEAKVEERKEEFKQKKEEKKEELKQKAGEELKRGLDKLFKKKE